MAIIACFEYPELTCVLIVQEMALRTVNNMAKILQKMFSEGKKLHDPEVIQMSLEPGIRSRSEQVRSVLRKVYTVKCLRPQP